MIERQLAAAPDRPAILTTLSRVVTPTGEFVRPPNPYDGSQPFDEWLFDRDTGGRGGTSFLQTSSLTCRAHSSTAFASATWPSIRSGSS